MNIIPPITSELGRSWSQPPRENILIDDRHALMSQKDFEALADYSLSQPTGCYDGKMWKSQDFDRYGRFTGYWLLRWFGPCEKPGYSRTYFREILILE